MKWSSGGWPFSLLSDNLLGVHQSKSCSTCLVTSPTALSQSSNKSCMLMVCGSVPRNSGLAPALPFMLRAGIFHFALFLTEYSVGLNLNSRLPAPPTSSRRAFTIFIGLLIGSPCSYPMRNPLCASSSVSVAAWLLPMSIDGPFHFTGYTPSRFQVVIGFPSVSRAEIAAVWRLTSSLRLAIQSVTFLESLFNGRVSLMFWYFARPGIRCTNAFSPPSLYSRISYSTERPSHFDQSPRSAPPSSLPRNRIVWAMG